VEVKMKKTSFMLSIFLLIVSVTSALGEIPPFKGSNHPEFETDLKMLKSVEVVRRNGALIFGKASLEKRDYIRVLHLKGTPFEMGYQHGILLKKEILEILKKRTDIESYFSLFKKGSTLKYLRHIEPKIPSQYIDEIKGMAAALNIDYDYLLASKVIWELNKIACTIVAANSGATADGNIIHLRSMENHPKTQTFLEILVIFYEPEQGNSFVSINGPGAIGVYSGMNQKQMTVEDNLVRCLKEDFSRDGIPLTLLRRQIIQYSGKIEDVQTYIEQYTRSSPNNILVTDAKVNEMRVYELGLKKFAVRKPDNGMLCSTNHPVVLDLEPKYKPWDSYEVYDFGMEFLKRNHGGISMEKLIQFIKSDFMTDARKRILQYIVIMAPKQSDFWVAVQKEDNKQACYNDFIKFNLYEEIKR
jgi:hypothetical protein